VNGGTLSIAAPRDGEGAYVVLTNSDIYATFDNADFETTTGNASVTTSGTKYYWTVESDDGSVNMYFCNRGWSYTCDFDPPQGRWALGMKMNNASGTKADMYTKVSIPARGNYDLSFMVCARSSQYLANHLSLVRISSGETNWASGVICYRHDGYSIRRYRTPVLEPGDYRFVIHSYAVGDSLGLFDDFKMKLSDRQDRVEVFPVPNGDFERVNFGGYNSLAGSYSPHVSHTADGWTLSKGNGNDNYPATAVGTVAMHPGYHNAGSEPYGNTQLTFWGFGGFAQSDAFTTLPAGTWRLRCNACRWGYNAWWPGTGSRLTMVYNPTFAVTATVNGVEMYLGSIKPSNRVIGTFEFPTNLTVSAGDSIVLSINNIQTQSCGIIDDLEFVRAEDDHVELVNDGGFEANNTWTFNDHKSDEGATSASGAGIWKYSDLPVNFGYNKYEGTRALRIVDTGSAEQGVAFPAAGTYRLTFHARPRVEEGDHTLATRFLYAGNRIRAYVTVGGEQRTILTTESLYSTNFFEYSALFTVPAAATYTLGFQGVNSTTVPTNYRGSRTSDLNVLIDGVSVQRAYTDDVDVNEDLEITLAPGAVLNLDFVGTKTVKGVKFGNSGRSRHGVISASRYPGRVTGAGALYVESEAEGLQIMVR